MKCLSKKHKIWLTRHAKKSNSRRLRKTRRNNQNVLLGQNEARPRGYNLIIPAPKILCLTENFDEFIYFLNKAWRNAANTSRRLFVDFRTIQYVSSDAALLLAATLDMWQRSTNMRLTTYYSRKWAPAVTNVFAELGLFELLKTNNPPKSRRVRNPNGFQILELRSGIGSDGSLADTLADSMANIAGPIVGRQTLYVGLTEAMTNVAQHAYPNSGDDGARPDYNRWWMTGSYDPANKRMKVLILDRGAGIPNTLPHSSVWERVAALLAKLTNSNDADMIEAAVEVGRSSTRQTYRGQGLDDIRQFVESSPGGRLRILSGRGEVTYHQGKALPVKITHREPMPGTLIEWEISR